MAKKVKKVTKKTPAKKTTKKTVTKKPVKKTTKKNAKNTGLNKPMKVSESLQAVIGKKTCSRPQSMKFIWGYIKENKLQDTNDKRIINPDAKLSKVIGKKPINMMKLAGATFKHLSD